MSLPLLVPVLSLALALMHHTRTTMHALDVTLRSLSCVNAAARRDTVRQQWSSDWMELLSAEIRILRRAI